MKHFYNRIQGWSRFVPYYRDAVREAKRGAHFVEVGSWKGRSAVFMAVEIINSGKSIRFDCVDTWQGSDEPAHHADPDCKAGRLFEVFKKNIEPVKHAILPIRTTSVKAAAKYKDESLDFVLLDAAHDYDSVRDDIEAWWLKIKPGGVMAGDDYRWGGVNKAVTEAFGIPEKTKREVKMDLLNGRCWRVRKPCRDTA